MDGVQLGGGGLTIGEITFQSMRKMESNRILTEGAVSTEAGSLFQHFTKDRPSPSAVACTLEHLVGGAL